MTESRDKASLAPIIVALAVLVSISLLGLLVAFWPGEPAAAPRTRGEAPLERPEVARDSLPQAQCSRACPKWI